jgi:hypothetical protein
MTSNIISQTFFIYALTIVISMAVAYMIKGLNAVIFYFEDAHKRKMSESSSNSNGKAA